MKSLLSRIPTTNGQAAKRATTRRAVRKALDIYSGKTRPTLRALAYLGGFPASRLYQQRWRRKHDAAARKHNGSAHSVPNGNGGSTPSLADMLAKASASERAEAAARIGPAVVWDQMVSPLLDEERASQRAAE
jgi:hypothetical protein